LIDPDHKVSRGPGRIKSAAPIGKGYRVDLDIE
jgi:hypothetical protein